MPLEINSTGILAAGKWGIYSGIIDIKIIRKFHGVSATENLA